MMELPKLSLRSHFTSTSKIRSRERTRLRNVNENHFDGAGSANRKGRVGAGHIVEVSDTSYLMENHDLWLVS